MAVLKRPRLPGVVEWESAKTPFSCTLLPMLLKMCLKFLALLYTPNEHVENCCTAWFNTNKHAPNFELMVISQLHNHVQKYERRRVQFECIV